MAIKKKPRKKGPVIAKSIIHDGIKFSSGLEKNMYIMLKKAGIKFEYEGETFTLFDGFNFMTECYERQANGKGDYINRGGKRLLPIKYTPDFIGKGFRCIAGVTADIYGIHSSEPFFIVHNAVRRCK